MSSNIQPYNLSRGLSSEIMLILLLGLWRTKNCLLQTNNLVAQDRMIFGNSTVFAEYVIVSR